MFRINSNYKSVGFGIDLHTPARAMRQLLLLVSLTLLFVSSKGYAADDFIDYEYYEGSWTVLPDFDALTPVAEGSQETFALTGARADNYAFRFTAKLFIVEAGTYTFYLSSDDGSKLLINNSTVIDFDGLHGASFQSGTNTLGVGYHDVEVQFFEATGAASLAVEWEGPNQARAPLQSFLSPDFDDDGIDNAVEGLGDSDGDGVADYLDTDSDGDGISDAVENANAQALNPTLEYESTTSAITRNPSNVSAPWYGNVAGLSATEGTELAHFNSESNLYYDLGILSPGTYKVSLDVGDFNNAPFPLTISSGIYTGGSSATNLGTLLDGQRLSNKQPASGTWNVWTYEFEIESGDPLVGQTFGLNFSFGASASSANVATDNIALSFVGLVDTDGDSVPDFLDTDSDNDGIFDNREHGLMSADAAGMLIPDYAAVHATNLRDAGFTLTIAGTDGHDDVTVNAIGMDADTTDGVWASSVPEGYRLSDNNEITWEFSEQVRARFDFQYTENTGMETYSLTVDGKTVLSGTPGDQIIEVIGRGFSVVGSSQGIGLYLDVDTRTVVTTTGIDTDLDSVVDRLDLDSDNDGVSDLYESGSLSGINADVDSNGTLDLAEATDSQNDGRMDVFGQFIMDDNTGWTSSDAARASNDHFFAANNGVSPSAGSTYIHFDTINGSYAHSEFLSLGEVFHAGTYQFSVDVLNVGNFAFPSSSFARATSGVTASTAGSPVASSSMQTPVPALGTSETWTYTLVIAANSALIGQSIGFEVGVGAPTGAGENVGFDNLQMTVTPLDTDADSVMNYLDLDSDQDGIPDTIEARSSNAYDAHADDGSDNVDSDGDGVLNLFDSAASFGGSHISFIAPVNTDGTDAVDFLDTDSDNDGLLDSVESGLALVTNATYADPDGTLGMPRDSGNTAEMDYRELDSDGDTISDSIEGNVDSDSDGIEDFRDIDDDGDGIPSLAEAGIGDGSAAYPFTSLTAARTAPSGLYWFTTAAGTFQGNVDATEGSGWVTILNYLHLGGTNPNLVPFSDRLPLIESSTLGTDESASSTAWGHTSNALLASLEPFETRWYAETSAHGRVIHFSTSVGINYLTTGSGDMAGIDTDFNVLSGHTSNLPGSTNAVYGNRGDLALTEFPFYRGGAHHWGIKGQTYRWETDDFPNNDTFDTFHRVWARGDLLALTDATDTDNDGTPDFRDTDSDADGINDVVEGSADTDGDGVADYLDLDSDNDGIDDQTEGALDTDSDGQPDYLDSDSDDDGVSDATEGATDSDGNSVLDFQDSDDSALYDADGDGISNAQEGLFICAADVVETTSASSGVLVDGSRSTSVDITSSGLVSAAGQHSFQMYEKSATTRTIAFSEPVIDLELLFDNLLYTSFLESFTLTFADGSVLPNANFSILPDTISANAVIDSYAALHAVSGARGIKENVAGNHRLIAPAEINGSSVQFTARIRFTDSRVYEAGNGIESITFESNSPSAGTVNMWLGIKASCVDALDSDNDGTPNYLDTDSDGDGIADSVEGNVDTDEDSIPDYLDTDSDNDGTNDSVEGLTDDDGDGIADYRDNYFDIIHDAVVWFRADDGVNDSGSGVSVWNDLSAFETDASRTPSAAVTLNEGLAEFNFNPSVDFDGSDDSKLSGTAASGSPDDESFIAVTRYTGNGSIEGVFSYGSKGIYVSGTGAAHQYVIDGNGAGVTTSSNSDSISNVGASLISGFYRAETTTNSAFYTNGALDENYLGSGRIPTGSSTDLEIGGRTLGALTQRVFQGQIAEVIQISTDISGQSQQSIIESYLATKYGISLDQTLPTNYVNSAGDIIWNAGTNAGYTSDVFGLSRDDLYSLDQRVSKSVNADTVLTIALDADFTSPNQSGARTTSHTNDKQYLYLSNNGETTSDSATDIPANEPVLGEIRIAREWRVTKSANFSQQIQLNFSGFDDSYYLIVDNDGDFTSGATVLGQLSPAGDYLGVALEDGQYITLVRGLDTDSDGTIDLFDTDDDNDGIPDSVEGDIDSDNDGIPNRLDSDSDGDGVSDITEGAGDTDNDGIPNYLDQDSDGDGVPDITEGPDTYIVVDNASVTGAEDTAIPLGINIDPSILAGGSQLDLISAEVGFRDASDGSLPVTFTVPQQATYVRITGVGGSDNSSSSDVQEDFVSTTILVDIRNATYSGHASFIQKQRADNANYAFSDVPLGSSTDSGAVVGHSDSFSNLLTVSLSGNTLSVSESQSIVDQAFHVEYLTSTESSSQYIGAEAMVLSTGSLTDSISLPANADFLTLSVMIGRTTSTNSRDEDKGVGYLSIDLEAQTASGTIYVHDGSGAANVSSYAFTDYDLNSGQPLLSSSAQVVGDVSANVDSLSNLTLSLSGNVLTVTRTADMANKYAAMFSANSYERLSIGSSARSLGSSAASGNYDANASVTNTFDLSIPGNAETATVSLTLYNSEVLGDASAQLNNENSGVASFSVDLDNETTSGSILVMRASTPDLVSWKNLPFDTRLMDHADTISNHVSVANFSDQLAGVLSFNRVTLADGSDVLRMSANPESSGGGYNRYQIVLGAQWSGQLPIEFATTINNGTLSHGALDTESGLWVVDPADVNSLAFVPAEHFSGENTAFTINYSGENDTVEIDVTRVADAPLLNSSDVQGTQRVITDASDSYSASLVDVDGSENLSIELTITENHTISDGTNSFTATAGNSTVDASTWNSSTFTYLSNDFGVFPVGIRAVATDNDGFSATTDTAETTDSFNITILIDTDSDGDADIIDTDDDNDGISDIDEGVADTDGDGTPDSLDTDSDGDGVPDASEGGGDADGDGILDHIDNDIDGDGILNSAEGTNDSDGDSIPDYLDTDSDGDGLGDAAEGAVDSDNDGILDYLDLDSDGDGIDDAVEGAIDSDNDGVLDYLDEDSDGDGINDSIEGAIDSDGDGAPDYVDLDADGDGISDSVEGTVDTDGDGQADYLDTDSDGDGIADVDEGNIDTDGDGIPDSQDTDANNDGIPDADLGTGDQDGDGVPDYLDDDIDGDGIANTSEGAPNPTDDSDGDGIPNYADTDSDNDGIEDGAEGIGDLDGDGIPDYLDGDSDGDGIADINEGTLDSDNDGIPDYADTDSDGDGVPDATEGSADTDLDGIPDYLDLDVDGDGIPDAQEGFNDSDGDGIQDYKDLDSDNDGHGDGAEGTGDSDGDGIADYLDTDSDNDGLLDSEEASGDTDGDGIPDYLDDDSDNDGIPDGVEGLLDSDGDGALDYLDDDSDNDGIPDNLEGSGDADGDGIPDYLDADSDNDGIPDSVEGAGDYDNDGIPDSIDTDANGDGIPDAALGTGDQDGDGVPDYLDGDIDGDGIANGTEGSVVPAEDSDGDGIPNYADTDSDNDGIPDFLEGTGDADGDGTPDAHDTDSDNDGIADSAEGIFDTDGDGIFDYLDTDSDGDGVNDSIETSADTDSDGIPNYLDTDSDNDGISDALEGSGDADGDGAPDFLDNDSDGDGITDGAEGTGDTDADGIPDYLDTDSDGDGIPDVIEGSVDSDGDGIPDSQDTDANGDGIPDANLSDGDIDGDGIPDYLDGDIDGDGIPNGSEGALNPAADSDGDGIPNYADSDSDNDGVPDSEEGTGDADGDGLLDAYDPDADNDGIPDGQEGTNDTDGDGVLDYLDSDSDNDGIPDSVEGFGDTDGDGIPDSQDSDGNNDGIPDSLLGAGDLDGDGIPDYLDNDIDGDGVSNVEEAQPDATTDSDGDGLPDFIDSDSDNDGVPDSEESRGDTDGDGIPDFADTDADGDGVPDVAEGFGDTDGDGVADFLDLDADNDGIPDVTEGAKDTDGDGVLDAKDLDSDNDGLPDIIEAGGDDVDGNGRVDNYVDTNSDGYDDGMAAVPLPVDNSDSDGFPDYKDLDSDNDGIPDTRESTLAALDSNGDGRIDDGVDAQATQQSSDFPGTLLLNDIIDEDGDGWADNIPANMIVDTDGDGTPNHQDLDSDGDGINDLIEAGGVDEDGDGQVDGWNDIDADGIPDDIDADLLGSSDSDGDGIADFADADHLGEADSDGDGIVDRFDIDPYDEGFARSSSGEPLLSSALPDTDGDGISDVQQPINEQGFIRTGLGGGGSLNPLSLIVLLFIAAVVLYHRKATALNSVWRMTMQSKCRQSVITAALLLSVSGCSTVGYQQQSEEPVLLGAIPERLKVERHVYAGVGVGRSRLNPDTSEVTTFALNDRSNAGQQITVGVDVSRQLSLELHSADLGAAGLSPEGGINYNMHGASALLYAGKNRHNYKRAGFTGYGRVGYGVMENSAAGNIPYRQEESNHLLIGAGLEYMSAVGLGFRAELISYEDDAQYGQLAIVYRMGSPRRGQSGEIAERGDEPAMNRTAEPLLQAAIAVSQEVNACATQAADDGFVYFDTNSVVMSTEGRRLLRLFGQKLIDCENLSLSVSAHTDETGSQQYNQRLSQRRASVVRLHLLSMGVQPSRIESSSYGETRPIAPNTTTEGRQLNRRVSMEIQ